MKYGAGLTGISTSLFALFGIVLGAYLNHVGTREAFLFQQKGDLRVRSYSKLMGLKISLGQSVQTLLEAKMLCEYYETKALRISKNPRDLEEAKRQNERSLSLIPRASDLQRDMLETLGEVMISFEINNDLQTRLDSLYNFKSSEVILMNQASIKTQDDLDRWKADTNRLIWAYVKAQFSEPFEGILPLLRKQI